MKGIELNGTALRSKTDSASLYKIRVHFCHDDDDDDDDDVVMTLLSHRLREKIFRMCKKL
jgi:hypothetical protein